MIVMLFTVEMSFIYLFSIFYAKSISSLSRTQKGRRRDREKLLALWDSN